MKKVIAMIEAHATLTTAISAEVKRALEAGLSKSDAAAVLTRYVEMLESED